MHIIHAAQNMTHQPQPGLLPTRQIHLSNIARDHHLRAETQSRQKHLHLGRGGVLRLVQDHKRIIERPPTHVRQRCHLDNPSLHQLRNHLWLHHVPQCIMQRPQIRVNLLIQRARKKAQLLPRLHRRTRQNNAADLLGVQRLHGFSHGQIRFTSTRRPQTKHNGVLVNGIHVFLLAQGFRADRLAAPSNDVLRQRL